MRIVPLAAGSKKGRGEVLGDLEPRERLVDARAHGKRAVIVEQERARTGCAPERPSNRIGEGLRSRRTIGDEANRPNKHVRFVEAGKIGRRTADRECRERDWMRVEKRFGIVSGRIGGSVDPELSRRRRKSRRVLRIRQT